MYECGILLFCSLGEHGFLDSQSNQEPASDDIVYVIRISSKPYILVLAERRWKKKKLLVLVLGRMIYDLKLRSSTFSSTTWRVGKLHLENRGTAGMHLS